MRVFRAATWILAAALPLLAASEGGQEQSSQMLFRIVNFLILAGALGYLIKKNAGAFFAGRSEAIRRGIEEARAAAREAGQRAAAIDQRLAGLSQEIAGLRASARAEMAAEAARIERGTEEALRKVFVLAKQEMAAAAKAARLELKAYAASLAVGLAEKKIAARITPQGQQKLVEAFVRELRA